MSKTVRQTNKNSKYFVSEIEIDGKKKRDISLNCTVLFLPIMIMVMNDGDFPFSHFLLSKFLIPVLWRIFSFSKHGS